MNSSDGGSDFRPQITQSLNQANVPKSPLAGDVSQYAQQVAPSVFGNLMNAQSMGNSFRGLPAASYFPIASSTFQPPAPFPNIGPDGKPYVPFPTNGQTASSWLNPQTSQQPTNNSQLGYSTQQTGGVGQLPNGQPNPASQQGYYNPAAPYPGMTPDMYIQGASAGQFRDPNFFANWLSQNPQFNAQFGSGAGNPIFSGQTTSGAPNLQDPNASIYSALNQGGWSGVNSVGAGGIGVSGGQGGGGILPGGSLGGGDPTRPINPPTNGLPPGWSGTGPTLGPPGGQPLNNGGFNWATGGPIATNAGGYLNPAYFPQQTYDGVYPGGGGQGNNIFNPGDVIPQFQSANPSLGQNNQALQTLLQQFQGPGVQNYNPSGALLGGGLGLDQLSQAMQAGGGANISQGLQDSEYIKGLTGTLQNQFQQGKADLRARYGAQGGGSRGTGASLAESQYDSQNLPALAAALGQARQGETQNLLQNQSLQNQFTLGQGGLASQLAGQAGNQSLGLQNLGSQNYFGAAGQNSQNANDVLGNQQGMNNLLAQLSQFNAQQGNAYGLGLQGQQQQAQENQLGRQFTGQQNLLSVLSALAGSGIPGGSANVNLGGQQQQQGGLLSALGPLASILGAFA